MVSKKKPKPVLAWHWLSNGKLRDGTNPPEDGVWLTHDGPLVMCDSGLHASVRAIDSLKYAPGSTICRVECDDVDRGTDKLVCRRRRILWRADADETLRAFARWCALSVAHLWEMPDIVRQYLETGDESLRDAAWAAAAAEQAAPWDAAWAAAWAASWDASWDATRDASWAASWASSWATARDAQDDKLTEMLMALEPKAMDKKRKRKTK